MGKTDRDFPWRDVAEELQRNDREVMSSGKTQLFVEQFMEQGEVVTVVSIKAPLRNQQGEIIGMLGNSIELTEVMNRLR